MTQYTEGPWFVLSGHDDKEIVTTSVLADWASPEHTIAEVGNHANALLIAAAPELLAICKRAQEWFALDERNEDEAFEINAEASEVIAKTEGR